MSQTVTLILDRPISSAKLRDEQNAQHGQEPVEAEQSEKLKLETEKLRGLCRALGDAVNKVKEFQATIVSGHKDQIARLSVEIAGKILAQKIEEGDYRIESIVNKALENAPTRQDVVIHLHPADMSELEKMEEVGGSDSLNGVKLVGDPNIRRAECLVESPKGTVESVINKQLERIGEELKKVE
ncbi:MAG: FliH/SctL family protein [Planctomycetota bacterium]|jgi:flagellar assembly protein FliH